MENLCCDPTLIQNCVERVLDSDCFGRAPQARRFLLYVTQQSSKTTGEELKAYTIGVQALGVLSERSSPETTARMQASRVRRLLEKYYQTEGRDERVVLQLPSGSYEPRFSFRAHQELRPLESPRVYVADFEALSPSQADEQFCRGLGDSVVGLLVNTPHLKVIRKALSQQPNDGFLLYGGLSRIGAQVRLSAQLLGKNGEETLWSGHFNQDLGPENFIQVQDHWAERIACQLADPAVGVVARYLRQSRIDEERMSATDRFYAFLKDPSSRSFSQARAALEGSLPQTAGTALFHAAYAFVLAVGAIFQAQDAKKQLLIAETHARLAVSKDSTCALGHLAKALIHYQHREAACVRREVMRVQELAVADGITRAISALLLCLLGDCAEGVNQMERVRALLPEFPNYLLSAHFFLEFHERGDSRAALDYAEQIDVEGLPWGDILMVASLGRLGRALDARRASVRILGQHSNWAKKLPEHLHEILFVPEMAEGMKSALSDAGVGAPSKGKTERAVYRGGHSKRALPSEICVGVLQSLSGTMALSETHLVNAAMLAVDEINQQGGVLGRRVRAVVEDGASDANVFGTKAERLIVDHQASSIFGCWTSSSRKAVVPVVVQHNALLWYPLQYEGLETSRNVVYTGSCLNQQIEPAVRWAQKQGKMSCYLIGSDYVFPRTAHRLIRALVESAGGKMLGEAYQPLGAARFDHIAAEIANLRPEIVYNTVNGADNVALFQALRRAGVEAKDTVVMSFSLSELELARCGDFVRGHLACWSYFQSMESEANRQLLARFRGRYGESEVLSDPVVTAYSQVHLWKRVVERAASLDTEAVLAHLSGNTMELGNDELKVLSNHHVQRRAVIGKVLGDQFRVIWSSPGLIEPQPWLGVDTTHFLSRDLVLGALQALPEMAAQYPLAAHQR